MVAARSIELAELVRVHARRAPRLMWLAGARTGQPRLHVSLLFVAGFVLLLVTGAANAIAAAFVKIDGPDSAWTTGNLHVVAFGPPALLIVGALYHWAPKLWGRSLSTLLGALTFLSLFGGFFVMGMASYALGYQGAVAHTPDMADSKYTGFSRLAGAGGVLIAIGIIVLLIDLINSLVRGKGAVAGADPYEGLTLEWATASPPPDHGFDLVPEVRSATPLVDVREAELADAAGQGASV